MPNSALPAQSVIVQLPSPGTLPPEVRYEFDVTTIALKLIEIIDEAGTGIYDGHETEFPSGEITLFMYGPDADLLFETVRDALVTYPLTRGSTVTIGRPAPNTPVRIVTLPTE